ncbi:MAG: hypothetical protein LUF01_12620 [Bacteroides sp.]|nr:hypothetical protein [Bacteroides sp.]
MKHYVFICIVFFIFLSCNESQNQQIANLAKEWNGKEILFPSQTKFTISGKDFVCDTIPNTEYKIVTYIDSLGCASCKLRLPSWLNLIQQLDTMNLDVSILFFYTLLIHGV